MGLSDLFENAGEKLRKAIITVTIVEMVVCILLGLILVFQGALSGLFVAVVGPLLIWFFSLFEISILEMISDVHALRVELVDKKNSIERTPVLPTSFQYTPAQAAEMNSFIDKLSGKESEPSKIWFCKVCGTKNKSSSRTCIGCGEDK